MPCTEIEHMINCAGTACWPSRQNTVESRSKAKPALGQASSPTSQRQSGRQNVSICAWEKRRKKLRMVSSLGKRPIPSRACKTRSARNHSQWAKRWAPHTTAIMNAVSECARGMALLEVGSAKGRCFCTWPDQPIWPRKEMKLARPSKGETAFGVSSKISLVWPKSEVISVWIVLCRVGSCCLSINPYAHSPFIKATLFLFRSLGLIEDVAKSKA